ncbi:MAG: hypothetical protein ACLFWF_13990 [Alphaproteobacteria bacterium]
MKLRGIVLGILAAALAGGPVHAADDAKTVVFEEVAPPYPSKRPPLNEKRTARPGDILYTERATGLPGARLVKKLILKNTPADRRVTIGTDDHLQKYLVDGEPWYCALYGRGGHRHQGEGSILSRVAGREQEGGIRKPGFYVCLRDGDGTAGTFEEVRILTLVLKVEKRRELEDGSVEAAIQRTYEYTMSGRLSSKEFTESSLNPDNNDFYDAVIELEKIEDGTIEIQAGLRDMDGTQERHSYAFRIPLSGPFPAMVIVSHPFEGDMVYRMGSGMEKSAETEEEAKRRERAAQLEILAVEGDVVTYRVTRGFQPWRFWKVKTPHRVQERLRWRPRP